jgi:hypothetical protein
MGEPTTRRIQIDFPTPVDMPTQAIVTIHQGVEEICRAFEAAHPDMVMWPFGSGDLPLVNWFMVDEDNPQQFDEAVFQIEVAAREAHPSELERRAKARRLETRGALFDAAPNLLWFARNLLSALDDGHIRIEVANAADPANPDLLDRILRRGRAAVDRTMGT